MGESSQNPPGALPPEAPPVLLLTAAMFDTFRLATPAPMGSAVTTEQAAAAVIDATMTAEGITTGTELAAAEELAGLLFQPSRVEAAVAAVREQTRAESRAEITDIRRQRDRVMRLIEGRPAAHWLTAAEVATAVLGDTVSPRDRIPMTLHWTGAIDYIPGTAVAVRCTSSYGQPAVLAIERGEDRAALAALLIPPPAATSPCETDGCGTPDDCDASDPAMLGWTRVEVAGVGDVPRWYCTPGCVTAALDRAGEQLADDDQAEAVATDERVGGAW
ncbi:hypothetical protein ABZX40_36515 [Streptomyces sp. NPDC004610]|uniref:hypothetical protein n=1 Tax=unclassified Streptomyces TaxID=2593676 RepID=UPI0033BC5710